MGVDIDIWDPGDPPRDLQVRLEGLDRVEPVEPAKAPGPGAALFRSVRLRGGR